MYKRKGADAPKRLNVPTLQKDCTKLVWDMGGEERRKTNKQTKPWWNGKWSSTENRKKKKNEHYWQILW